MAPAFVHPVAPAPGGGDDRIVRTVVRRETVMSRDDPAEVVTEPGTFSARSYKTDLTKGGREGPTGCLTPPFGADRPAGTTGDAIDPYDRGTPIDQRGRDVDDRCRTAARS
ncbi:hypothetical protein [Streptomyces sp. NPDC101181]|uniref:hypothetical protein n=1 Tax=Streptomyces sp. NPDC101181 TaxID=3366125 RepID=UPI003823ABE1